MLILDGISAAEFCRNTASLWGLLGIAVTAIKVAIPIILIVMGMLDMGKAVTAGKDEEIKKSALTFLRRAIAAVLIFLTPTILILISNLIGAPESLQDCMKSIDQMVETINNESDY